MIQQGGQRESGQLCLDGREVKSEGEVRSDVGDGLRSRRRRVEGREKEEMEVPRAGGRGEE